MQPPPRNQAFPVLPSRRRPGSSPREDSLPHVPKSLWPPGVDPGGGREGAALPARLQTQAFPFGCPARPSPSERRKFWGEVTRPIVPVRSGC
ncbi:hypothetical protein I79_025267 [Cricetulus griseus]|uniref:Uncharacterized protein n=1 Tax=Cricetulus griseus TaxID=10029 RepID=G3IMW3_CRIGR|nr:hypothetical protein I79_025267 [Cricetulus griseus]